MKYSRMIRLIKEKGLFKNKRNAGQMQNLKIKKETDLGEKSRDL